MAACSECGTTLPRGASACPQCGTPAPPRAPRKAPAKAAAKPAAKPAVEQAPGKRAAAKRVAAAPDEPAARPATRSSSTKAISAAPAAKPAKPTARPSVKASAERVVPSVKAAAAPVRPTPKAAKAVPAGSTPRRSRPEPDVAWEPAAIEWGAATRAEPQAEAPAQAPGQVPGRAAEQTPAETPVPRSAIQAPPPPPVRHEVLGEADERHPDDPIVHAAPTQPGILVDLFEQEGDHVPLPARIVRGDWRATLTTALPALLVTLVLAGIAATSLLFLTEPGKDEHVFGDDASRHWVKYTASAVGLSYGSTMTAHQERRITDQDDSDGDEEFEEEARDQFEDYALSYGYRFAPLTLTFLSLGALWFLARRRRSVRAPDRVADAVRVAAVYAAGVAAVTALARWELADEGGNFFVTRTIIRMSPWKALFWAFGAAFVVVYLAAGPLALGPRVRRWLRPARGALAGVAGGVAVSFVAVVLLAYAYADKVHARAGDVTRALPLVLTYGVNLGTAAFGTLVGGAVTAPYGPEVHTSLWTDGIPGAFALLLVVPALAVLAGAYLVTRGRSLSRRDAARECALMGVPAALLWLVLAIAAMARVEGGVALGYRVSGAVGGVLWNALLVGLWFGAGGWLAGRALGGRTPAAVEPAYLAE